MDRLLSRRVRNGGLLGGAAAVVVFALVGVSAQTALTKRDAETLQRKIDSILTRGIEPTGAQARTIVTEREVNSYLQFAVQPTLPAGVVEPSVRILGHGRLSGRAVVDLDAVREDAHPASVLDPVSYLRGRVPVTAVGVVTVRDGVGRFTLESAAAGTLPLPKLLLQYIVSYYSRTADDPDGISLDEPFAVPAGIRTVAVEQGRAIIVQ